MKIIALHHCLQVQISRFEKQMGTYLKKTCEKWGGQRFGGASVRDG